MSSSPRPRARNRKPLGAAAVTNTGAIGSNSAGSARRWDGASHLPTVQDPSSRPFHPGLPCTQGTEPSMAVACSSHSWGGVREGQPGEEVTKTNPKCTQRPRGGGDSCGGRFGKLVVQWVVVASEQGAGLKALPDSEGGGVRGRRPVTGSFPPLPQLQSAWLLCSCVILGQQHCALRCASVSPTILSGGFHACIQGQAVSWC